MSRTLILSEQTRNLFKRLNRVSQEIQQKIYLVGGYLRDLLLGKEGKDIDFVVIGDAIQFA